jgi:hypothetical protein
MFEVTFVATGLGLIACISSLILVAYCMHANYRHQGDFIGNVFGSSGRNYLHWCVGIARGAHRTAGALLPPTHPSGMRCEPSFTSRSLCPTS